MRLSHLPHMLHCLLVSPFSNESHTLPIYVSPCHHPNWCICVCATASGEDDGVCILVHPPFTCHSTGDMNKKPRLLSQNTVFGVHQCDLHPGASEHQTNQLF
eukprot:GDKI01003231.1.p2 GENE.GDKI01003231.1~~GDKI01003231.1.p2  ORF type:complete len:102 (+),score=17.45 GDKI01003231.1:155-460(+)